MVRNVSLEEEPFVFDLCVRDGLLSLILSEKSCFAVAFRTCAVVNKEGHFLSVCVWLIVWLIFNDLLDVPHFLSALL